MCCSATLGTWGQMSQCERVNLQPFPLDVTTMYPMVLNDPEVWDCHIRPFALVLHNVRQGPPLHSEVPVKKSTEHPSTVLF